MKKGLLVIITILFLCSCSNKEVSNVVSCPEFYKNSYKILLTKLEELRKQ